MERKWKRKWKRKFKLMLRWSLVSGVVIALFWTIWYIATGSVPVANPIKITPNLIISLPLSRWWDILIGPVWSVIIVLIFPKKGLYYLDDNLDAVLAYTLFIGLFASAPLEILSGLPPYLLGLGLGLGASVGIGLYAVIVTGFGFGLGIGLITGLINGLIASLIVIVGGLVLGGITCFIIEGLYKIFSKRFFSKIINWLLVR